MLPHVLLKKTGGPATDTRYKMLKIPKSHPPPELAALLTRIGHLSVRGDRAPLSELEWVQRVLALVQSQAEEAWIEPRYFNFTIPAAFRAEFLGQLESLMEFRAGNRRLFAPELEGSVLRFQGLTVEPFALLQGGRIYLRNRIRGGNPRAALDYTICLILRDDLGMLERLARCPNCRRFFIKNGQHRRYCTSECTQLANRQGTAQRVAAMRAGMSVAQFRAKRVKRK